MKIRKTGDKVMITASLPGRETDKFLRVLKIYNDSLVDVTPAPGYINLPHLSAGLYAANPTFAPALAEGIFVFQIAVYEDAGYTTLSQQYGNYEEDYWLTDFEASIIAAIPSNPVLVTDPRLDDIANKLSTTDYNTGKQEIKDSFDDSDGTAQ